MIKTSKLILIRHAPVKTEVGCFPDNDPDAIIDELKIKKLAGHIPEDCLWYVSPLKRTIQTANALSKYVNVKEMKFEKRLKEQNFGDWAGKKISEVWKELKKNTSQHNFSFICPEVSPPKGENFLTILVTSKSTSKLSSAKNECSALNSLPVYHTPPPGCVVYDPVAPFPKLEVGHADDVNSVL